MRAIISGGGTAGHINPALSIAKKIMEKEPDSEILFVGTPNGMENRLVGKAGFPIRHVEVRGFKRRLTAENIKAAWLALTSVGKAKKILREFRPDAVIGTGGYVCWPVLRAASKMKIPTLVHEQNAIPGLTVSKLSKCVDTVCYSFEGSGANFPCEKEKLVLTGNPVGPEVLSADRARARRELGVSAPFLLSYGGSLGASVINENAFELAKRYSSVKPVFHTHAFGAREWEKWSEKEKEARVCRFGNVKFCDYIYDMPRQMAAADLVISRAGAITLAELACLGKPAVLIPSPNVVNDHQTKNARLFEKAGAAVVIEEKDLTVEKLIETVNGILFSPEKQREMQKGMKTLARPDADEKIYAEIRKLLKR